MFAGAPAGAGWQVSESVPNDSKVIELNTRQGTQVALVVDPLKSDGFNLGNKISRPQLRFRTMS